MMKVEKEKMEMQSRFKYYEKQIEDQTDMIAVHDKMNIALSDHGRTQDKAINNLILVRSLLDALLTKSMESQRQLLLELDETQTKNKRLQLLLHEAKSEMLMMEQSHDNELDKMTDKMLKTEKENADLVSRVHKQVEIVNALTTRQRLLGAGYTATLKSYAQAT